MTEPAPTIQDILRRQQETFAGRAAQIERFRDQLSLSPDDPGRLFVLGVAGQGGVGKSTLLRQFIRLAQAEGAAAALSTDEAFSQRRTPSMRRQDGRACGRPSSLITR